jgi:DNA invertase Pin-like site-specific DNA recombinase
VLSFAAQSEFDSIRQRQREGITTAKTRGVRFGRPIKAAPPNFGELAEQWYNKQSSKEDILKTCNMSKSTFYRRLAEYRIMHGQIQ